MNYQITEVAKEVMKRHVQPGDLCMDATMGRGKDTAFLCTLTGENGFVHAFDIQPEALDSTEKRLKEAGITWAKLHLESHEEMDRYAEPGTAACITFNLGYLPGADHACATRPDTTLRALDRALPLLKKNGLLSVLIYSGGDSGFEERDAVLAYLKNLDPKRYLVLLLPYYNRPGNPPLPAFVIRL